MSIRVERVEGNINDDSKLRKLHDLLADKGSLEHVLISRKESTKSRLRLVSDRGREVIIDVPRGVKLRHGDVLSSNENHMLVAEWIREDTMIITVSSKQNWEKQVQLGVKLGYILGIKHWPLCVDGNTIFVPVEDAREDTAKPFSSLEGIDIKFEERILETSETSLNEHSH